MKTKERETALAEWRDNWAEMKAEAEAMPEYAEIAAEVDREHEIGRAMEEARKRADLTQAEVAKRMKTTQSVISRMARSNVTIRQLARYFAACGARLELRVALSKQK